MTEIVTVAVIVETATAEIVGEEATPIVRVVAIETGAMVEAEMPTAVAASRKLLNEGAARKASSVVSGREAQSVVGLEVVLVVALARAQVLVQRQLPMGVLPAAMALLLQ